MAVAALGVGAALAVGVLVALTGGLDGLREFLDRWSISEWAVAAGTLVLAAATWQLGQRSQEQTNAALRPFVYPIADREWVARDDLREHFVVLRNGGPGAALHVEGVIEWPLVGRAGAPQTAVFPSGGLGPHEERWVRVPTPGIGNWHNANGQFTYMDVTRQRWRTTFATQVEDDGRIIAIRVVGVVPLDPNDL